MDSLAKCPFCGSGWLYETRRNGYCDDTPAMFCNSCKAVVTWEQVEEEGVNDETKTFVREHWNTRAERTCEVLGEDYDDLLEYWETKLSCGHVFNGMAKYMNYCPSCGAKVVGE